MKIDDLKLFLPKYLSAESERDLFENLLNVSGAEPYKYFSPIYSEESELLQGDAIDGMQIRTISDTKNISGKSLIISNSCDLSLENARYYSSYINYAPLIKFDKFINGLKLKYPDEIDNIESLKSAIIGQRVTSFFYLPASTKLPESSIVLLSKICTVKNSIDLSLPPSSGQK